jgi:acetolactate synthase-1/3 small subunit
MKHTLVALVENKPGVLNRVASLFRRKGFNIDSLTVGRTENPEISRMTIVVDAAHTDVSLVERNLSKLVNIIELQDVTREPIVARDLALIRVKANGGGRAEIMQLVNIYRAKIVDVAPDSLIVEVTGPESKIDSMVELLRGFGIQEMVRTGQVAMLRGMNGKMPPIKATPRD